VLTEVHTRKRIRREFGASLIEVLVSIVIASIGLLALAGINAASLRYSKMSQYRATASQLVNDIAERIRANNTSAGTLLAYTVNSAFVDQVPLPAAAVPACNTVADSCTDIQMAAADLQQWRTTVRSRLPEGSVSVLPDAAVPGAFDVWIAWRDPTLAAADETPTVGALECSGDLNVAADPQVRCLYFRVKI
jgi:type IV pilus assembly protein PilV